MRVVSRIKIMANLDIAERRVPQDGRFALPLEDRRVDIRVVTLPLVHGESVVLRILDKGEVLQTLELLGMHSADLERFAAAIGRPNGAVLVTGPTGSGKSTTLYAALNVLNHGEQSIITIEDPVEQRIAGIKQMQIAPKAGVTFDVGLRSMLRADPDVIMVGEIRDRQTAHIAVEAALTGHLVLSTLHTRDAPNGLGRLIDMGIEPFLVASSINLICAQRLLRKVCQSCKTEIKLHPEVLRELGLSEADVAKGGFFEGKGCVDCNNTGYKGRCGVYEVFPLSPRIRDQILDRASTADIKKSAVADGMLTLRSDALIKLKKGITTAEEVLKETAADR